MGARLSDHQIDQYCRDGFLVVPDFVDRGACDRLRDAANTNVDEFTPTRASA